MRSRYRCGIAHYHEEDYNDRGTDNDHVQS